MGVVAAMIFVLDVVVAAAIGNASAAPSFRRGGRFVAAGGLVRPLPYSPAPADPRFATTTTTAVSRPARSVAPATAATTPVAPMPGAAVTALPGVGTYKYAVTGTESATGFGSRAFPADATMSVHHADGLQPNELVADLTLSSDHQEREILQYGDDAVGFSFEGGKVTFGSASQTSEATYDPVMAQVLLINGTERRGTSKAESADGSVNRVEDWTVTRSGTERLTIAGASVDTVVFRIHRQTHPGSADQLTRDRTYWYDPARHLWVKWSETMHGERKMFGLTFTYDNNYTATLTGFTPAG